MVQTAIIQTDWQRGMMQQQMLLYK